MATPIDLDPLFDTSLNARCRRLFKKLLDTRFLLVAILVHLMVLLAFGGKVLWEYIPTSKPVGIISHPTEPTFPRDDTTPPPMPFADQTQIPTPGNNFLQPSLSPPNSSPFDKQIVIANNSSPGFSLPPSIPGIGMPSGPGIGPTLHPGFTPPEGFFPPPSGVVRKIIFVTDTSKSMKDGEAIGHSFKEVIHQIEKYLSAMPGDCGFNIITFDRSAYLYKRELTGATDFEKRNAVAWLKRLNPEDPKPNNTDRQYSYSKDGETGSSRAHLALEKALLQKPDVIYFLSDGVPSYHSTPAALLQEIQRLKKECSATQTPIHAVFYKTGQNIADNEKAKEFMAQLAKQNHGKFVSIEN